MRPAESSRRPVNVDIAAETSMFGADREEFAAAPSERLRDQENLLDIRSQTPLAAMAEMACQEVRRQALGSVSSAREQSRILSYLGSDCRVGVGGEIAVAGIWKGGRRT